MKKTFFLIISAILFLNVLNASAQTNEYKLKLNDFTELKVDDPINVEYYFHEDSVGYAVYQCAPEWASRLLFTMNKKSLTIQIADSYEGLSGVPKIKVYSSCLEKIENGSDSTVTIKTNRPVKTFKAKVIGNGTIDINKLEAVNTDLSILTGHGSIICSDSKSFKTKLSNIGTGTIQAGALTSSQVKVMINGTGNIDCSASESLTIYGIGSGAVYYTGTPKKITNRSIGIKVYPVKQ